MFQFVPNWIADDFNEIIDIEDIDSEEIIKYILNNYNDYLTEFFFQIYQNGADYRFIIINSKKYPENMINEFVDTYISILTKIINSDMTSNLSTLK